MGQPAYDLKTVRKLLTAAFGDEELNQFCLENSEFRPVYEQFSAGMSKTQKIQRLIEYCERKVLMERLLALVKEEHADQYAEFENELTGGQKAAPVPPLPSSALPSETEFLHQLLIQKTRELYDLQLKAAQFGALHTPSYMTLRIQDLEKEIAELDQKLNLKP
jgi:hypothetical protein